MPSERYWNNTGRRPELLAYGQEKPRAAGLGSLRSKARPAPRPPAGNFGRPRVSRLEEPCGSAARHWAMNIEQARRILPTHRRQRFPEHHCGFATPRDAMKMRHSLVQCINRSHKQNKDGKC